MSAKERTKTVTTEDYNLFITLTDVELMAITIYGEAEGEDLTGKAAVGFIIRNRAALWKKTIKDVCLQANQFECFNKGNKRLSILRDIAEDIHIFKNKAFNECLLVAQGILQSDLKSTIGNATFYKVVGWWSSWFASAISTGKLIKTGEIGLHEFFTEARFMKA